ncbi:hypothetical protein KLP28_06925 [Nocardioidaceae bacterium]|nr:hypothetical protein KLP28_06925 [Nocardioidaceae bacterium]
MRSLITCATALLLAVLMGCASDEVAQTVGTSTPPGPVVSKPIVPTSLTCDTGSRSHGIYDHWSDGGGAARMSFELEWLDDGTWRVGSTDACSSPDR